MNEIEYEYLPIDQIQEGDIVQWIGASNTYLTKNKCYIYKGNKKIIKNDKNELNARCSLTYNWKLVKTKPGNEAKPGDTIIFLKDREYSNTNLETHKAGSIFTITSIDKYAIRYGIPIKNKSEEYGVQPHNVRVLCKKEELKQRRNLAFYKRSGKPWTNEEFENICKYTGSNFNNNRPDYKHKFIFDDESSQFFMWDWDYTGWAEKHFRECKQVAYEDIFESIEDKCYTETYCEVDKDSATLDFYIEGWKNRSKGGCSIYVYTADGSYRNKCIGLSPKRWKKRVKYASTVKCDNILEYFKVNQENNLSEQQNQIKEITMAQPTNKIEIKVNDEVVCTTAEQKAKKVKTDLEARKKYTVVIFNVDDSYSETLYINAKDDKKAEVKATKILQRPANIGKTAVIHKEITALTTNIPVVKANV